MLQRIGEQVHVWLDSANTNAACGLQLQQSRAQLLDQPDRALAKACKNDIEISGMLGHRKDAIAVCQFLAWLDQATTEGLQSDERNWLRNSNVSVSYRPVIWNRVLRPFQHSLRMPHPHITISVM